MLKNNTGFQSNFNNPKKIDQLKHNFLLLQEILQMCKTVEIGVSFQK